MTNVSGLAGSPPAPKIIGEKLIYHGYSYRGLLTYWSDAIGWTHSLSPFGQGAFASPDLAEADFWKTKERLPPSVHRAIFGRV